MLPFTFETGAWTPRLRVCPWAPVPVVPPTNWGTLLKFLYVSAPGFSLLVVGVLCLLPRAQCVHETRFEISAPLAAT